MFRTVYVSSANRLFSEAELDELLQESRANNSSVEITGILLYRDGNFMQLLEGPKEEVQALMEKIKKDNRHHGVLVLLNEENYTREFTDWAMGFKRIDAGTLESAQGYSEFLNASLTDEQFVKQPSKALKLLLGFKKNMR